MKTSRYSEEQIIGFLKQADGGMPIKELCRKGGFSDATFCKWRAKFGGMDVSDAKRLKELEAPPKSLNLFCRKPNNHSIGFWHNDKFYHKSIGAGIKTACDGSERLATSE